MRDVIADHAKDWMTLMFVGLGINFMPHQYLGGLFLALAGAAYAMKIDPEQDQLELWIILLGALFASHVAAIISFRYFPDLPVQLVMAATGFFSRRLARFTMNVFGKIEGKSGRVADRLINTVLPGQDDKGDGQ